MPIRLFRTAAAIAIAGTLGIACSATAGVPTPSDEVVRRTNGEIVLASYPPGSLRRGEQGTVEVAVTTDAQGRLRSCQVSAGSGFPALDEATCDLLILHMKMRPFLAPNGGGIVRHQQGRIVWALPQGYKGPIAVPAVLHGPAAGMRRTSAAADPNRKICRPQATTGSLIASQRICLTRAEWQQQYIHAQEETQDMHPKFLPGG